jgi:hypothetical protein
MDASIITQTVATYFPSVEIFMQKGTCQSWLFQSNSPKRYAVNIRQTMSPFSEMLTARPFSTRRLFQSKLIPTRQKVDRTIKQFPFSSMAEYKDPGFSTNFVLLPELVSEDLDYLDSPLPTLDPSPDIFSEMLVKFETDIDPLDFPNAFSQTVHAILTNLTPLVKGGVTSFPFSDEFIDILFHHFNSFPDSSLFLCVLSRMLDIISLSMRSFPTAVAAFARSNIIGFVCSLFSEELFFTSHVEQISRIVMALIDASPLFLTKVATIELTLIPRIAEIVLRYKDLDYPTLLSVHERPQELQWKEYLEFSLPILAAVLPVADISPDNHINFFNALYRIGCEKFVFDESKPAPDGISVPIMAALIQCLTMFAPLMNPAVLIGFIREHDEDNDERYRKFFRWAFYVKEYAQETRQQEFFDEIVCNLCPLFLLCIQIDPPIFLDFQHEGLVDLLSIPLYVYSGNWSLNESRPRKDSAWIRKRPTFVMTQKHFEVILDLIVTILQKIANGEITEQCSHSFQRVISEGLKEHLRSANSTRTRILIAFATITVHTEESMKQRIIFEFGCLPGMIDLIDQSPPETAALLVRALVILLDQAIPLDQDSRMEEILECLDFEEIETNLPEQAVPDLEQLRGIIDRIRGK